MSMLLLALKSLRRDLRAADVRALLVAMIIAVAATTMIGFFLDRLTQGLERQAGQLLGGDVVLVKGAAFSDTQQQRLRAAGFDISQQTQLISMASHDGAFQLASLKVVDRAYPLYGQLMIDAGQGARATQGPPSDGRVWIDRRLGRALSVTQGDTFQLGRSRVEVAGWIQREPDQRGGLESLNPHIMLSPSTLMASQLIQPGSRSTWRLMGRGSADAVARIRPWLEQLKDQGVRVMDVQTDSPRLGRTLDRVQKYLSLAGLAAVLLAGVAVAMATRRYVDRHLMTVAMMRCFGSSRADFSRLFVYQLSWLALAASLVGAGLGWLGQYGLASILSSMLTLALPAPGLAPLGLGILTAVAILAGFAGPTLLRLENVSALKVLRRELDPLPASAWVVLLMASAVFGALLWLYSGDAPLAGWVVIAGWGVMGVLWVISLGCLAGLSRVSSLLGGPWRMGIRQLGHRRRSSQSQLIAFTLTLAAVGFIALVRSDLLSDWQQRLPEQAPNQFAINIQPAERDAFVAALDNISSRRSDVYPLVRGRISAINGQLPREAVPEDARDDGNLRRELNLTWRRTLPEANRITRGAWFASDPVDAGGPVPISVAERLATRLGLSPGDTMTFEIADQHVTARITSIRKVDWESFQPNFFVIFPPGVLEGFSHSFITAFYVPPKDAPAIGSLVSEFPAVSFLDITAILDQVDRILDQVSRAIAFILLFVALAGVAVLYAALVASLPERAHEGALLRVFGAQQAYLRQAHISEFVMLGGLSGVMAAMVVEAGLAALYAGWLDLPVAWHPLLWGVLPAAGMLFVGGLGVAMARPLRTQAPVRSLGLLDEI
ncbi:ABC transporter permease [Larsenimonas sp. GH2-1]|uniref:ABC transporter permease n=2 Tax=Larsenimonas rhizosphaerae TaxID=2944682 RepID=A0AA42CY83_9GAMM|nr:ABC transporter permease [Larsenimonas rhizosphaerae]